MKKIRIGINGFGRIGRIILRNATLRKDVEVVAINDPFIDIEYAKYMFVYDTVFGKFDGKVEIENGCLVVNDMKIRWTSEMEPSNIDWARVGADYIAEATGKFKSIEDCTKHINAGAKKVIITAPGKDDIPMFVMGVNDDEYESSMTIISNGSCTTNCLAPLARIIHNKFGIAEALMTTVHSTTATQLTVDGASRKDWRGGRSASANIIPSTTGAATSVTRVIPSLAGRLTGMAFRVPTINVSVVDFTVKLESPTTYENICAEIRRASREELLGIVDVTNEPLVSSDIIGNSHTCVFDEKAGIMLNDTFVKLVAWYDNEWAYSAKVIDLIVVVATRK